MARRATQRKFLDLTKIARRLALCTLLSIVSCLAVANSSITYPKKEAAIDSRYDYDWAVLRMALEKTCAQFGPYDMQPAVDVMGQARVANELQDPRGRINIFARATTIDLERRFIPIRIPIDRGLLGYRLLLVRAGDLPRFSQVHNLDSLRQFSIGLGKGWTDVAIMKAAGFNVVEGNSYEGLFSMLSAGRFDVFSRSVDEAYREFGERHASIPNITVEPTLLIYYPLPRYFFLRRDSTGAQLAKRIETGLQMMVRDGTLQNLFHQYKGPEIKRAALERRRLLRIPNPFLPPNTPLERRELWYDPIEKLPTGKVK